MKLEKKKMWKTGCLAAAGVLFLLFVYLLNQVEKTELLETEGRNFENAVVTEVIKDNVTESGNIVGDQTVLLRLESGGHAGEEVEAISSSGYLFGAQCTQGMKVIALVSESQGELVATVYSVRRAPMMYFMVVLFILAILLIGGKKGFASVAGLAFTILCVIFVFFPLIYRGASPIWTAVFVVIVTTVVTMFLIDGVTCKSAAAILGTIIGVCVAGVFAWVFGKVTHLTGYSVSDVENLVYVEQNTDIQVGELLFAGILIATLGAVMDVSMSIASTICEIHQKNPALTTRELFHSGMNVGKDMMGTMSNTLILAFTGGSMNTLVFLYAYNYQYRQVANMASIGIEVMQGVSASMGVIMAVPFVSLISAWMWGRKEKRNNEA